MLKKTNFCYVEFDIFDLLELTQCIMSHKYSVYTQSVEGYEEIGAQIDK